MAPPEQDEVIAEINLQGFGQQNIEAIEIIATESGLSFDDACKQELLKISRQLRADPGPGLFARLFGIGVVR